MVNQDFPEEGAPTPRGAPTYELAKFFQKLHEIERIWTPRGGSTPPLDPPLLTVPRKRMTSCKTIFFVYAPYFYSTAIAKGSVNGTLSSKSDRTEIERLTSKDFSDGLC